MEKKYTIEEQDAIGKRIAEIFFLKKDKNFIDRYETAWGNKTATGIFNTVLRIAEDIKQGNKI